MKRWCYWSFLWGLIQYDIEHKHMHAFEPRKYPIRAIKVDYVLSDLIQAHELHKTPHHSTKAQAK